jgi:hypothetical protein
MSFPFRRAQFLTDVGITMHGLSLEQWKHYAIRQNALFGSLFDGIVDPIQYLHAVLGQLARGSGKKIVVPADMLDGVAGTTAIFRSHHPGQGSGFGPHFDGFQQGNAPCRFPFQYFECVFIC